MAAKKTVKKPAPATFVSATEFNSFKSEMTDSMQTIIGLMQTQAATPKVENVSSAIVTEVEKEIKKADPNDVPINPEWEKAAHDIIGDAVDHCEIAHIKSGGLLFTVVIKNDYSNAPKDYLARHGQDRRTKEIGNEGFGGVELWCKLIKQNLARTNENSQR